LQGVDNGFPLAVKSVEKDTKSEREKEVVVRRREDFNEKEHSH